MVETATRTGSAAVEGTRAFLQDLFSDYPRDFAVRFWDGTVWEPDAGREARSPSFFATREPSGRCSGLPGS